MTTHIIGTPLRWTITTYDGDGEPVDADAVPAVSLRINQAASLQSVTPTKRAESVGLYDCAAALAGLAEGDHIEALATVEIDGASYHHAYEWRAVAPATVDSDGTTALLARITARLRTAAEADAADQAILDEIASLAPDTEQIVRDILDGLGSVQITRIGPEFDPETSTVTLIAGDDYLVANGSALTFAITLPGIDLANARAVFSAERTYHTLLPGSAELVDTDTDQPKLRLQWTRSQTNTKPNTYAWGVAIIDAAGLVKTIIGGPLILKPAAVNPAVVAAMVQQ